MRSGQPGFHPLCKMLLAIAALTALPGPRPAWAQASPPAEIAAPLDEMVWVEIVPDGSQPKFKTWLHPSPEKVVSRCALRLSVAQWTQDIAGFAHSAAHFDNCALRQGADFVQQQVGEAEDAVKRQEYGAAMFALGKALHAVQDFYAHTNYVEKMAEGTGTFEEVEVMPLWTEPGRARLEALLSQGLASGVVSYSDLKVCPSGSPDHNVVAKDTADFNDLARKVVPRWQNRSHYTAALDLAEQATESFLTWAFQRWPGLSEHCGRFLGYAAPGDHRHPETAH